MDARETLKAFRLHVALQMNLKALAAESAAQAALDEGTDDACKAGCKVAYEHLSKQNRRPAALMQWLEQHRK